MIIHSTEKMPNFSIHRRAAPSFGRPGPESIARDHHTRTSGRAGGGIHARGADQRRRDADTSAAHIDRQRLHSRRLGARRRRGRAQERGPLCEDAEELAEGTYLGGVFSILLMFVFVSLFGMQLRALWTVGTRTDIAVDHSEDAKFQVNFKVELPALSCEWATVDVIDALGTRHFNISGESIYKHSMGASRYLGVEHASAGRESQREPEYGDTTDLDHYGNRRIAYEVTGATFERMIRAHKVLLVEFHAPWCSHCQRLAPIYEHAAELVRSELRRGKRARLAAALATVDCTVESNKDLCKEQHVQAFPTLRVYRAGSLHPVDLVKPAKKSTASEEAASKDLALVEPPQLQFEGVSRREVRRGHSRVRAQGSGPGSVRRRCKGRGIV